MFKNKSYILLLILSLFAFTGNLKAQPTPPCSICLGATSEYYSVNSYNSPGLATFGLDCEIQFSCWIWRCPDGTIYISNITWTLSDASLANYDPTDIQSPCYKLYHRMNVFNSLGDLVGPDDAYLHFVDNILAGELAPTLANPIPKCPEESRIVVYSRPTCTAYCYALCYKINNKGYPVYKTYGTPVPLYCANTQGCCETTWKFCFDNNGDLLTTKWQTSNNSSCPPGSVPDGVCGMGTIKDPVPSGWKPIMVTTSECSTTCY